MTTVKIYTLSGDEPHPDNGGWDGFLRTCDVRRWEYGVIFYGVTNCNYILFPCGLLLQNFGYHGHSVMQEIAENGPDAIIAEMKKCHAELKQFMAELTSVYADT